MLYGSISVLATALLVVACAAPQTQLGSVSQDQIVIEQARQQQFALQSALKQRFRLQNVADPLLRAAVPLCGDKIRPISGYVADNAYHWKKDYFNAARSIGYSDTLTVMNVTPGLPAAAAGVQAGDMILAVNETPIVPGPRALKDLNSKLPSEKQRMPKPYSLTYRRGADTATATLQPEMACAYTPQLLESDDINAYADGRSIFVTTGILRFVADDDELAVVVGHELAHDAMRHIDAMNKNSLIGALLGAVVDVAAATQGVNTNGDFSNQGARLGSMVFSQDFEREADYVGLYVLALAGRPIEDAPNLWRRFAAAHPGSIKFATSHPTTAERYVRLDKWRQEIGRKLALGQPLRPEMKKGSTALATSTTPAISTSTALVQKSDDSRQTEARKPDVSSLRNAASTVAVPLADPAPPLTLPTKKESPAESKSHRARQSTVEPLETLPSGVAARAVIGAPSSDLARLNAVVTFAEANAYVGSHQWGKAEESFRKTLLLDGSVAKYHAGLASLFMLLQRYQDADAEYTAALLLDLDNPKYRRLLKVARSKR